MTSERSTEEPPDAHGDGEPHHGRTPQDAHGPSRPGEGGDHGTAVGAVEDSEDSDNGDNGESGGSEDGGGSDGEQRAATTGLPDGAGVWAEGFGLRGPRGPVFADIAVDAAPGSLIALEGPSGSGRTCLLLALTGRMKSTEGSAVVGGHRLPKQLAAVRRVSGLGQVPGVTDLDPSLTVAEHLRERALLERRFTGSLRTLVRPRRDRTADSRARVSAALDAAGLELEELPKGQRTRIGDLERLEALRLSVALALIGQPRLLAVDDLDLKLSEHERDLAWGMLRSLADSGTTVLAVCSEAPEFALTISTAGSSRGTDCASKPAADGAAGRERRGRSGARRAGGSRRFARRERRRTSRSRRAKAAEEAPGERHTGRTEASPQEPGSGPEAAAREATEAAKGETADALAETGRA